MLNGDTSIKDIDRSWASQAYRFLVLSRTIEDRLHSLFKQGRLRGRLISGRGQEAIPVGATLALRETDVVAPVHRDLGVHLVRGTAPITIFRHYLGRVTGPSRGRDGDIHMGEWGRGVFPMVSQLPDSWPVMVGAALGFRLAGEQRVALAFCGDGATSTGTWHEAINFAAVFELPVVFIVENNQYAYSTPTHRQYRVERLADRSTGYGIPGATIDGNDVIGVNCSVTSAVEAARHGAGPTLIEAVTMRMDGHAVHDAAEYVPRELIEQWAARDPLRLFEERLRIMGWADSEFDEVRRTVRDVVDDAWRTAEAEPMPGPAELDQSVYADAFPGEVPGALRRRGPAGSLPALGRMATDAHG